MARVHRSITLAAAVLGRCAGLRRARSTSSLFVPSLAGARSTSRSAHLGGGGDDVRWRPLTSPLGPFSPQYKLSSRHRRSFGPRVYMSTVNNGEEVLQSTTYESGIDEEDEGGHDEGDEPSSESPSSLLFEELKKSVDGSLKNLSKKSASLQRELEKAQSLEETMARAQLIVSNLYRLPPGTTSAEVEDWKNDGKLVRLELNTKKYGSAQEEADALFALARKMKRGSIVVEDLLQKSLEGEEIMRDALLDLETISTDDASIDEGRLVLIQERLERTSKRTGFQSPKLDADGDDTSDKAHRSRTNERGGDNARNKPNPRELTSPSGHRVLVGRNRRDNDALCFQLSKPTDTWMHSRGCPGAHVLLCCRRGSPEVTDADLQFAANLAAFYSDARTELRAKVTTASPRHITKPRGAPMGAVSLRQEGKTLIGKPGDVSDDLKEAREKSGAAWDEMGYRKLGTRAKNKKRAAATEKARKAKGREEARDKSKRRKRKEEQDWY